ncbi:hypothetical protein [Roseateles sp.]|uniref:hypothetical protein n=1 Tax=Roseateles sp. TaxID=1971397 RepID=UPI003267612B
MSLTLIGAFWPKILALFHDARPRHVDLASRRSSKDCDVPTGGCADRSTEQE